MVIISLPTFGLTMRNKIPITHSEVLGVLNNYWALSLIPAAMKCMENNEHKIRTCILSHYSKVDWLKYINKTKNYKINYLHWVKILKAASSNILCFEPKLNIRGIRHLFFEKASSFSFLKQRNTSFLDFPCTVFWISQPPLGTVSSQAFWSAFQDKWQDVISFPLYLLMVTSVSIL